jgi:hypothetical protein
MYHFCVSHSLIFSITLLITRPAEAISSERTAR